MILKVAEQWHLHPDDVDPRSQPPRRARWFWWQQQAWAAEAEQRGAGK